MAFPSISGPKQRLQGIPGNPPDLRDPPGGCRFHPRCPRVMEHCRTQPPPLCAPRGDDLVLCHLYASKEAGHQRLNSAP